MNDLSVIIPAYNEEEHIVHVLTDFFSVRQELLQRAGIADVEVIVVNDGSTDSTGTKLSSLTDRFTGFRVITHEFNQGYGAALKTGFEAATGEFLAFMDADGTIQPLSFVALYQKLKSENADMAVGTRFGEGDTKMPLIRRVGNRFFANLLSFLSGQRVRDTASGVRLFRRDIVTQLLPLPDGLHFTPAMSTKAVHEKLKVVEVPVPYDERSGASKLNVVSDGVRFLKIIVGTVLLYNPFKVFLLVGLPFIGIAGALLSEPLYELAFGPDLRFSDYIYRSIAALYFFIAGVQIILFGILARFMVSTFFRSFERGDWIHKINRVVRVYDRMTIFGLVPLVAGLVINALYFIQYFRLGDIRMHWAWLLLAAGAIIVGLQMAITGVVMRILKDIRAAKSLQ